MSGRERKPSAKARELASYYNDHDSKPSTSSSTHKKASSKPKTKPTSSGKSKRVYSQYDEDDEDWTESAATYDEPLTTTNDFEIPKAYCVCLGDDDSTPMIQCEGCENWFHFRCINLHEDEAKRIKKYFCENCSLAGLGQTKYFGQGGSPSPIPEDKEDTLYDSVGEASPSESEIDEENAPLQSKKRGSASKGKRPRKRAKAEGTSDEDEDSDPPYMAEMETGPSQVTEKKPKRKPVPAKNMSDKRGKLEALANKRRASTGNRISTDPSVARTRQGVKTQLLRGLADIYTTGEPATGRLSVDDIERELFTSTAEPDEKGALAPRNKYTSKFRSLFTNLRSNAYLRSRISGQSTEEPVTANMLVNMGPEDLMSPEQRAMQQQLQAKSMRDSIKSAIEAPKAKVTHKGEEVIDDLATTDDRIDVPPRPRLTSLIAGSPTAQSPPAFPSASSPQSPGREREVSFGGASAQPEQAFSPRDDTLMGPPLLPRSFSGPMITPEDVGGETMMDSPTEEVEAESVVASETAPSAQPVPASPTTRGSFDIDSLWGSFKDPVLDAAPLEGEEAGNDDVDMMVAESPVGSPKAESSKLPVSTTTQPASTDAAADLDAILRQDAPPSQASTSATPAAIPIDRLAPIWDGTVDSPDEVRFPAFAVQVAGRLLGTNRDYWHRVVPPNLLRVEGRLATQVAADYLVQNTFSTSRELVVLALLPDLSGPSPSRPDKPSSGQAQADYSTLIHSLSTRGRAAVVLPQERQKRAVKDIYLCPLLKTDPVPDFVELLEAHALGEGKERDRDYLLLVAVLQKTMLPPPIFDMPTPVSLPPPTAGMPPAGLDPSMVQALLAQPQLLQALAAQMPPQQPANFPPRPMDQQIGQMLSNMDPSALGALLQPPGHQSPNYGGQSPPRGTPAQAPSPPPMGMSINPARQRMMDGGNSSQGRFGGGGEPHSHRGGFHGRQGSGEFRRGGGGYR